MFDILEEPTLYHGISNGDFSRSQENFEDFMNNYLSILGYKNLQYVTNVSFFDKKRLMQTTMIKDICRIANIEEYDKNVLANPMFVYAYTYVLNSFVYVFGKYFYFNLPFIKLYPIINKKIEENIEKVISGDGENMINVLYNILEPYFSEVHIAQVNNHSYLMKN